MVARMSGMDLEANRFAVMGSQYTDPHGSSLSDLNDNPSIMVDMEEKRIRNAYEALNNEEYLAQIRQELDKCPEREEVLLRTRWYRTGLVLKDGIISLWDDSDILEVDIYDVDALRLMAALEVHTVDELYSAVKECALASSERFSQFLDAHGIHYSSYSSRPDSF